MPANKKGKLFWQAVAAATAGATALGLAAWYKHPLPTWDEDAGADDIEDVRSPLIRDFLPEAEFAGEVSMVIHAPPDAIFAAIRSVTLDDMPLAAWLISLRYLPGRLLGKTQPESGPKQTPPFIDLLINEYRYIVLAEIANQELILGAIGKFHNVSDQRGVPLGSAREFVLFAEPDYQKLAISFWLSLLPDSSGSRLIFIHGTHALSSESRRKFARYWLAIKPGGNFVSWLMLAAIKAIAEKSSQPSEVTQAA